MTSVAAVPANTAPPVRRMARGIVGGVGAIAVFSAFAAAMALLWEHTFGFSTGEAWALSISLASTIAMLVAVLVIVVVAVKREEAAHRY
jgi:hypothetical protein